MSLKHQEYTHTSRLWIERQWPHQLDNVYGEWRTIQREHSRQCTRSSSIWSMSVSASSTTRRANAPSWSPGLNFAVASLEGLAAMVPVPVEAENELAGVGAVNPPDGVGETASEMEFGVSTMSGRGREATISSGCVALSVLSRVDFLVTDATLERGHLCSSKLVVQPPQPLHWASWPLRPRTRGSRRRRCSSASMLKRSQLLTTKWRQRRDKLVLRNRQRLLDELVLRCTRTS